STPDKPTDAGTLLQQRFGSAAVGLANSPVNPVVEKLLAHRTHRVFADQTVPEDMLTVWLAAGFSAPSKSDLQQASIVHVCDRGLRRSIADLVPAMPWIGTCPEFFVVLADGRRITRIADFRGKAFANDNLDNFVAAVCDASLVLQNLIVAAESFGLGCCPISVIRDHMERVSELLGLPDRVVPIAGLCLGWPAREGFVSLRLPLEVTVHRNRYQDDTLPTLVDAYDRERDARFRLPPDRRKYVREFGEAEFYGWSEDKARQMAREERADVGEFVRTHGFSLR
ncbi:MAG TPA: nitroreductase family protein, partial [Pseudomonadales bacterium]